MSYVGAVTAVLLLLFVASLRTFVHTRAAEAEWRWTVTVLSGAIAVALVLIGSATRGAAAVLADHQGDAAAVSALFTAAKITLSFALIPIAAMATANARTMA